MPSRKPGGHRKAKSHDAPPRRSTGKPTKHREERAPSQKSPTVLPIELQVPKALKEILLNSRTQIKSHDKVLKLPKEYRSPLPPPTVEEEDGKKERAKKPPKKEPTDPYPGPPNVSEILEEFNIYFKDANKSLQQSVEDDKLIPVITRGIRFYFEKTLGTNLLYMEERGQLAFLDNQYRSGINVVATPDGEQTLCDWYGADHLLRLLVMLPEMLQKSSVDDYSIDVIGDYLKDLLDWLDENKDRLFLPVTQYVPIPSHYHTDIRSRNHVGGSKTEGAK